MSHIEIINEDTYTADPQLIQMLKEEADIDLPEDGEIIDINDLKADGFLRIIKWIENEIAHFEDQKKQMASFYDGKIEAKRRQINFLTRSTYIRMDAMDKKTWSLPTGTYRRTIRTSPIWTDDESLVAFSKEQGIITKVIEKPVKKEIKSFIKETGIVPDGYEEETKVTFSYKLNEEE